MIELNDIPPSYDSLYPNRCEEIIINPTCPSASIEDSEARINTRDKHNKPTSKYKYLFIFLACFIIGFVLGYFCILIPYQVNESVLIQYKSEDYDDFYKHDCSITLINESSLIYESPHPYRKIRPMSCEAEFNCADLAQVIVPRYSFEIFDIDGINHSSGLCLDRLGMYNLLIIDTIAK